MDKMDIMSGMQRGHAAGRRKRIERFFRLGIFKAFRGEFLEWEEYKKKVEKMEEKSFERI